MLIAFKIAGYGGRPCEIQMGKLHRISAITSLTAELHHSIYKEITCGAGTISLMTCYIFLVTRSIKFTEKKSIHAFHSDANAARFRCERPLDASMLPNPYNFSHQCSDHPPTLMSTLVRCTGDRTLRHCVTSNLLNVLMPFNTNATPTSVTLTHPLTLSSRSDCK